jgi:hypothetical protein
VGVSNAPSRRNLGTGGSAPSYLVVTCDAHEATLLTGCITFSGRFDGQVISARRSLCRAELAGKRRHGSSTNVGRLRLVNGGPRVETRWLPDPVVKIAEALRGSGADTDMRSLGPVFASHLPEVAFIRDWTGRPTLAVQAPRRCGHRRGDGPRGVRHQAGMEGIPRPRDPARKPGFVP